MQGNVRFFTVLIGLSAVLSAQASIGLRGEVRGGSVSWENVTMAYGKMAPSEWQVPPLLQTSTSWKAGTFAASPPETIKLTGSDGVMTEPLDIQILGIQYNASGIEYSVSDTGTGSGCRLDTVTLPIVSVEGDNCISSYKLNNAGKSSPFVFFRPLFSIDDQDIISVLRGKTPGLYSASIPIIIRYYYENHGITTFRNINEIMIISLKYDPVQLDRVNVTGDGVMVPNYNSSTRRITSSTEYFIEAIGYFDDGIKLTMLDDEYSLINSSDFNITIPYSIVCSQCQTVKLVDDGQLLLPDHSTYVGVGNGPSSRVEFNLMFSYDVDGTVITSGEYTDQVTIMIDPSI
ncbi:hypothetical protein A1QO_09945 [Vibrio genomosp. F10 str. ZF-129]|uniref:Fimbrial protein n=1 Tax=Vibrio genomosp. F10 str. ZF-129 TaxID=1187848 RepID=A0A1E5BDK9_9VIBR|nr:hypothetical protein [Vibrio genomosp. F10]OEE33265.1 hypothetical protein A1QO_09945 [Vibrio genomosp. F10 str. ZF-129]